MNASVFYRIEHFRHQISGMVSHGFARLQINLCAIGAAHMLYQPDQSFPVIIRTRDMMPAAHVKPPNLRISQP